MKTDIFSSRHIGISDNDLSKMLTKIGVDSLDQLIYETLPDGIKISPIDLPPAMSEHHYLNHIEDLGNKNQVFKSYIGMGYHPCHTPSVIKRNILENPGWYTAYTPYQAEIAQGRLEALINYQTMICDLTGMELANASLLDEGTAAAEAMTMLYALRDSKSKKENIRKFFVSQEVFPQTIDILRTKAAPLNIDIVVGDHNIQDLNKNYFGQLLQYTGRYGQIFDYQSHIRQAATQGVKTAIACDILSLVLLQSPSSLGADVVVGTTQRFGIPMGYGGPHAAFFATKEDYKRHIPGRIIGLTKDLDGQPAMRMALQTREQHIKRDRATSNICTAQVLLAVMAGMYAIYHGAEGLRYIAKRIHQHTTKLNHALQLLGIKQYNTCYFDTLRIAVDNTKLRPLAIAKKINFQYIDNKQISLSINETTTDEDINELIELFESYSYRKISTEIIIKENILKNHLRKDDFLTAKVFYQYHSETELMRYIKRLERKDLSLNHSMIALGSCTMKLNAASEMFPISHNQWTNIHPFVPENQSIGYKEMLTTLANQLSIITGFTTSSLQPNSGAQGEYAGLMAIRAYHESRGEEHRNICLIPASAHGTNPASAVLAGMKVIIVKTTDKGNIDIDDIKNKAVQYQNDLAALMVTYPSTHGVFESAIRDITNIIHDHGGQVYMDGANMNAQVGLTSPAKIGADVCHLNLHKTFAIPHGGGGPGVGPICVADHLTNFLPTHGILHTDNNQSQNNISSAPYGSALVCLISYGYICMLGANGLRRATEIAILNANYIKSRLENDFGILYSGECNRVGHEMILDCRNFKPYGIEVIDIAKRLIDYGFHAPTISFPVAGTMMIEPTESESKAELDRFCDALIAIKNEILTCSEILKNAPHTLQMLTAEEWPYPYERQQAAYPLSYLQDNKFWPGSRRVDEAFGDRNLMCTCQSIENYIE